MLSLGWIDFSKSDRDMVLSVLRQLTESGAVDELGIGTIRDGFSDILFPGISTIQTRAKYLFIVPYICMELERDHKLSAQQFVKALEQNELALIDILAVDGAEGVIGKRSRQTLKRKPSSIYWSALRTYGFMSEPVTLYEYASLVYARKNGSEQQKGLGKSISKDENDTIDDLDTVMRDGAFWRAPAVKKNWREDLTIKLSLDEALYLREKIVSMTDTRDSLLALVLRENRFDFPEYESFEDIDDLRNLMPLNMIKDYRLARDFARFIFGAQVRYNVIHSEGQNEYANELWERYLTERPTVSLADIQTRLKPRSSVMHFLKAFQLAIDHESELDRLIIRREKDLKGSVRAKLTNKEFYQYDGNSINMMPLVYRLPNARRIVRDIFEGVEGNA